METICTFDVMIKPHRQETVKKDLIQIQHRQLLDSEFNEVEALNTIIIKSKSWEEAVFMAFILGKTNSVFETFLENK